MMEFPFMIFPSWLFGWYFTVLCVGRQLRGLLDKHPMLSRSSKHHCYCYCLMPCTSIVVLQQSTHTYVIMLRGRGTIEAIVKPPTQISTELCVAIFAGLEVTSSFVEIAEQDKFLFDLAGFKLSVEDIEIFCKWNRQMDDDENSMKGSGRGDRILWTCCCTCAALVSLHMCISKGKHWWWCQQWVITLVFSTPWAGSEGCDGWLAVWPLSPRLLPLGCLELWAEWLSGWGWTRFCRQWMAVLKKLKMFYCFS